MPTTDNHRLCPGTKPAGLTGLLPGCFSHEPGTTRAGPGARFSSTREAPGRAGLSKKMRPARFFRAGFPGAPGPVPAPAVVRIVDACAGKDVAVRTVAGLHRRSHYIQRGIGTVSTSGSKDDVDMGGYIIAS